MAGNRSNQYSVMARAAGFLLTASAVLGVLSSCSQNHITDFDYRSHVGWMHGSCLAIANDKLAAGEKVTAITLGDKQTVLTGAITGRAMSGAGCFALLEERKAANDSGTRSFYAVAFPGPAHTNMTAVGLVHTTQEPYMENGTIRVDLDGDGRNEIFGSCLATEGMFFYVWSEADKRKLLRWSDYYYLGYDNEPTCPDEEKQPEK